MFYPYFQQKRKTPWSFANIQSLGWIEYLIFHLTHNLIGEDIFILSSISSGLDSWSINYTSIYENSELKFWWNI